MNKWTAARWGWIVIAGLLARGGIAAPTNYPPVSLAPGSDPRFASVSIDAWSNHVAYLLFDGNVKDGYNRMYVWSPNYAKYSRPVALTTTEGNKYSPLTVTLTNGDEMVNINWQFNWGRRSSGDHFDYITGKLITVSKSDVVTYPVFGFLVEYARGPRPLPSRPPVPPPLDVQIPAAEIWVSSTMTNLYPTITPWYQLNYYMTVSNMYVKDEGYMSLRGRLNYGYWPVKILSVPKSTVVEVIAGPYLEPPTYDEKHTPEEVFVEGIKIKGPYGWYDFKWNVYCDGLVVTPRTDPYVLLVPYPFPSKAAAGEGLR